MPLDVLSPTDVASTIERAWADWYARRARSAMPHKHVYASSWRECDRRMVLDMSHADHLPQYPPDVLARFSRGDDRERDLLVDLMRIGRDAETPFKVTSQQERFELRDRNRRVVIAGKVDARIEIGSVRAPLEVKSWSPLVVQKIKTFEDVFENPWTRSGGYQILSYLYGASEPFGFLLLDRAGLPLLLVVELDAHLDKVEAFLARAEAATAHLDAGTLPDYIDNPQECQRCPFYGAVCNPPLSAAGTEAIIDPDLEAALERRHELEAAATEYDRLDKDIKLRLRGVERAVVGHFVVRGTWGKQNKLELPAALKAQYTTVDPKGRFTLSITRL